ncbi:MAG: ABC transporter ATP-binding protein [Methanolobus sp.]|nr:ABC transporter ATP-binding protein [Methanolobus sp.]
MENIARNIAIEVENLSKKYSLGSSNTNLKLSDRLKTIFISRDFSNKSDANDFFALKDLNFVVKEGETLGIVGRNGAGKSTLLKILSRITEPTSGRVIINGSIASVLEVGMGFHPDLTGRENVYLSGTMLGLPKKFISEKFNEIVEFAGMQRFIDTPVKHYSSGMYVRLAFSVVVNIEADILLFDEVLSVGDYSFQMQCYQKIAKLANSNKTIVIVSHNNNDLLRLCSKVMYFENGKMIDYGDLSIIKKYFEKSLLLNSKIDTDNEVYIEKSFENVLLKGWDKIEEAPGDNEIKVKKVFIKNESRKNIDTILTTDKWSINIEIEKFKDTDFYDIGFMFSNMNFLFLAYHIYNSDINIENYFSKGTYVFKINIDENTFNDTVINIGFSIVKNNKETIYYNTNVLLVKILQNLSDSEMIYSDYVNRIMVPLRPKSKWEVITK